MNLPARGGCRCGVCRYTIDAEPIVAYTCHCQECQKLTGSAFLTCMHIPAESLTLTSGTPSTDLRLAGSGNTLCTYFCQSCSSTLFIKNTARPLVRTLHVGSLDQPELVNVNAHIWVKRKLPWVQLPPNDRIYQGSGDWRQDYTGDSERYG